jgi:hypothetical protein
MEQSLAALVQRRTVDPAEAIARSSRRDELVELLQRAGAPLATSMATGGLRIAEVAQ